MEVGGVGPLFYTCLCWTLASTDLVLVEGTLFFQGYELQGSCSKVGQILRNHFELDLWIHACVGIGTLNHIEDFIVTDNQNFGA